ncbi:hypothetical protein LCGC14_1663010 [marine sediment metagenome]|uniref:Uncharacterized protein n=1 Tax=marine sediment metagenome TaxID=412755 RepID=A0A0F9KTL0_9ZZZZ
MRVKPWCSTHKIGVDPVYVRGQDEKMARLSDLYACHTADSEIHFFTSPVFGIFAHRDFPAYLERDYAPDA